MTRDYLSQLCILAVLVLLLTGMTAVRGQQELPRAFIDGSGPGWKSLGESDFVNVNCADDTWRWKEGIAYCTGTPYGVIRSQQKYTNFELVLQWRLMQWAGDSGVFVWVTDEALQAPARREARFPHAIEVQVMDHGFVEKYEKEYKKKADWFTTHGDVFPFGSARMKPFPPVSPNGTRSFPSKHLSKGVGEWNHYYIRCINGEVRVWVNGEEVSGGTDCYPRSGYIALESEGAPVEYKQIRIRELP